jgi:RNA-dependent RNA polymerase
MAPQTIPEGFSDPSSSQHTTASALSVRSTAADRQPFPQPDIPPSAAARRRAQSRNPAPGSRPQSRPAAAARAGQYKTHGQNQPAGAPLRRDPSQNRVQNQAVYTGNTNNAANATEFSRWHERTDWRTGPELTVRLMCLPITEPVSVTTWDLWAAFQQYGTITSIEIIEDQNGRKDGTARVRFSHPPENQFWASRRYTMKIGDEERIITIEAESPRGTLTRTIRSPARADVYYPSQMILKPSIMQFGMLVQENAMVQMKTISGPEKDNDPAALKIEVDLFRKKIKAYFGVPIKKNGQVFKRVYQCQIKFSQIKTLYQTIPSEGRWALIVPLECPPSYFWKREDIEDTFIEGRLMWGCWDQWYRVTYIAEDGGEIERSAVSLHTEYHDDGYIDIGRWTTLRFEMESTPEGDRLIQALHDFNINTTMAPEFEVLPTQRPAVWDLLDPVEKDHDSAQKSLALLSEDISQQLKRLPFHVRYQLEACLSRNIILEHTITAEFMVKLSNMQPDSARHLLEYFADRGKQILEPMNMFENEEAIYYFPAAKVPHYCAVTRKVIITPTTVHLSSPAVETTNRVIRKYNTIQDRFLRVQFTDELAEGRINAQVGKDQNDELFKRVYRALRHGMYIGGRHYKFLAFGSSQIREAGAYFFCQSPHVSTDDIRRWMGSFTHIRVVAKYASRLGQCFSTTREIRGVAVPRILTIPDVERDGYCFTDGVGKISRFLAEMVVGEMVANYHSVPSAYQIRMGGCKGVLAVWPQATKMEVHIRKSQEKFKSEFNGLEICKCAQFTSATLNRQTITILSTLGVPKKAFLSLLAVQLKSYENAMTDVDAAIGLLGRFVDENQTTLVIADMLLYGFLDQEVNEPFVLTLLNLWKLWSLKMLKEKARIVVEQGAFVLGCVDETGTLRGHMQSTDGLKSRMVKDVPQIFLQITDKEDSTKATVVTGVCIVGRNPALHPGDIRVVEAVNVPELKHLRDVVVFPSTGDRDVPSMCGGGDLDGDDFFVIWDQTLIPPEWHYPPMNYTAEKPTELNRDVNVTDLAKFYVLYMKNNILPTIAHAHLAQADYLEGGAKHEKCEYEGLPLPW